MKDVHVAMMRDHEQKVSGFKQALETWEIQAKIHQYSLRQCQSHFIRLQHDNRQITQERDREVEEVAPLRARLGRHIWRVLSQYVGN